MILILGLLLDQGHRFLLKIPQVPVKLRLDLNQSDDQDLLSWGKARHLQVLVPLSTKETARTTEASA